MAQLGARVVWDHQAAGSIPVTRTKNADLTAKSSRIGNFGRSDRTRTCSILVPNQARYQLRYTSKYKIVVKNIGFTELVKIVVKRYF